MEEMVKSGYLIREQIGQGAFGVIYHALDEKNHREAAIKVWKAGSETEIFSYENSPFLREERIPGIVKIYDYFEKAGMNFLVMEYLPGGTLKEQMSTIRSEKSPEKILDLFKQVMEGLAFLHSEGLVHCDLSPDNLMFDETGNLKLIDLGACRGSGISCEKKFLKDGYSAPEQYTDTERIGPWTDVYGLCAVLYETLSGEKIPSAAQRLQKDELRPLSTYIKINRQAELAVMHGLRLEIQQRYFSIELLLHGFGTAAEELEALAGSTRHFWGQKWIQISGQGIGYHREGQKRSRRMVRRIALGTMGIVLAGALFYGGDLWFQNHYPVQYFKRKADNARKADVAREDDRLVSSLSQNYSKILEQLTEYAPEAGEKLEAGSISCELTEAQLLKWNVPDNFGRKMYLDKESIRKALFLEMGFYKEDIQIKTDKDCTGFVSRSVDGSYEMLKNTSSAEETYRVQFPEKETETYKIVYDPTDKRVISLYGSMTDPRRLESFVKALFPVCCPEGYLTTDEIGDIREQLNESEDSIIIQAAPHGWINFFSQIDAENKVVQYYVKIAASDAGLLH